MFASRELGELLDEMDAHGRRARRAHDQHRRAVGARAVVRRRASRPLQPRHRRPRPPAPDAEPAQRSRASSPTTRSRTRSIGPSFWGDGMYPPGDAVYFPLYTKCCELDLPLCMNTGLPGPPIPGEVQNPIHLDRVCVRFPELKLCMMHGADPWWDVAIRLMIKYANLRLMTSAWSPAAPAGVAAALHVDAGQEPGDVRVRLAGALDHRAASRRRPRSTSRPRCSTTTCTRTPRTSSSAADAVDRPTDQGSVDTRNATRLRSERDADRARRVDHDRQPGAAQRVRPADAAADGARTSTSSRSTTTSRSSILRGADGVFSTGADMANAYSWYGSDELEAPAQPAPAPRRRPREPSASTTSS